MLSCRLWFVLSLLIILALVRFGVVRFFLSVFYFCGVCRLCVRVFSL